jgi:hypothetical protein
MRADDKLRAIRHQCDRDAIPFAIAPCQAIPDCARSFRATPANPGEISLPAWPQTNFPNGKQTAPRKPQRQKIVTILFLKK